MTVTVECRAAQTRDASNMAELIARCNEDYKTWAPAGWNPPGGIAEREETHLTQRLADPSVRTLVAVKGDQLIAFAMWAPSRRTPGVADLSLLFVDPASWGIGLGRQLLLQAEQSMLKASFSQAEETYTLIVTNKGPHDDTGVILRMTQRKPMWLVEVSIAPGWQAGKGSS